MGGNAVLGHLVHLGGADLHFHRPVAADHGGVQRLIAVRLGQADVVLEAAGDRPEGVVHHGEGPVAPFHVGSEDAQGRHIEDFVEGLLLVAHLAPDAIEMLRPARHLALGEARRAKAFLEQGHGDRQPVFAVAALAGHLLLDLPVGLGLKHLEGQILQFPFEAADAEPVGQGRIDLAGFAGNPLLLLRLERPQGAHVVEPVGQLDQHDADVTGHGQKHAAQILGLGLGVVGEMNASQLGDALHQRPHLGAKMGFQLLGAHFGVLDHVVEETGGNHAGTCADVTEQIGDGDRMDDVRLAGGSHLTGVELVGEIKGAGQQRVGIVRAGFAVPGGTRSMQARNQFGRATP